MSALLAGVDWQFVVVTLAALWGAWILLRPFLLARRAKLASGAGGSANGACASCSKCSLKK